MKKALRNKNLSVVKQQDQSDCGVACLLTIIRYHGGSETFEKLRNLSGTSSSGTTMLGLLQCAEKVGFQANGFSAEVEDLAEIENPVILHVLINNKLQHYLVLFPAIDKTDNVNTFLIGVVEMSRGDLDLIWQSKSVLVLSINEYFITKKLKNNLKWEWFWTVLKPDHKILTIAAILGLIITILSLAMAIFSQRLIDNIIPSNNKPYLLINSVGLFFVLALRPILNYVRQHLSLIQTRNFSNRIVLKFFGKLISLPKFSLITGKLVIY